MAYARRRRTIGAAPGAFYFPGSIAIVKTLSAGQRHIQQDFFLKSSGGDFRNAAVLKLEAILL
jgi:hypothetical protein